MAPLRISLVPFEARALDLDHLIGHLSYVLSADVNVVPCRFDPLLAFNSSRGQYDAAHMLDELMVTEGDRVLGVTTLDLFIPIFTFVFGLARLGGRTAVVSSYRLEPGRYGFPDDPDLLRSRVAKEAVHELGHTFGLAHCEDDRCVMYASRDPEDVDEKEALFCAHCALQIPRADHG